VLLALPPPLEQLEGQLAWDLPLEALEDRRVLGQELGPVLVARWA